MHHLDTLPTDVIYEIARHISASDLLNLSRTTRKTRNALLNRSTRRIWIKALMDVAVDMPMCPRDISSPAYASLMLERFCSFCGRDDAEMTLFALRRKTCVDCFGNPNNFVGTTQVINDMGAYVGYELALPCMRLVSAPRTQAKVYPGTWHPASDVDTVIKAIREHWTPDELQAMNANRSLILSAKAQMAHIIPPSLQTNRTTYQENLISEPIYLKWITQSQWVKQEKFRQHHKLREIECLSRLETMDFEEEVAYLQSYEGYLHRLQFSRQPWITATAMVKKSALKAHKAELVAFMEKVKAERNAARVRQP